MFLCNICGLNIQINNKYELIENLSEDYIVSDISPEIVLEATEKDIEEEILKYPQHSKGYHEGVVLFRKLCEIVLPKNIFFFHSAVVAYNGNGYIFAGKSGAGKSTHAALWEKVIHGAEVINGDKPLIKLENDEFYAYGTPWCGKEMMQKNKKVKVSGVCFIEQAKENSIEKLSSIQVIGKIFDQTVYMKEPKSNEMLMDLINKFITDIPFYLLKCDISEEAVALAYNTMNPEVK